jgi:uncharacterized membrane protein YidH (DUF202 family)
MKNSALLGILLIVAGVIALAYGQFNYTTREKILEVGPIKATADHTKTLDVPPALGWTLLGSGVLVVLLGARNRSL